jgi:hypothetical protein
MLRRELLKALAAFVTAGPAVAAAAAQPTPLEPAESSSETAFSGSRKSAVSAKSSPVAFTPPTAPAEPEPAVFGVDLAEGRDYSPLPPLPATWFTPQMQALREALWNGDQLPVDVSIGIDSTRILFFYSESARSLGANEHKQALARHAVATMIPTYAQIYNAGAACEVTFRRIEA